MTNSVSFQWIGDKINELQGAPVWLIVALLSIILGYMLKIAKWFPNQKIPLVVILVAAAANIALMFPFHNKGDLWIPWSIRQLTIGLAIGFSAWIFHRAVLKRFESKFPWLQSAMHESGFDTEITPASPDPSLTIPVQEGKTGDTSSGGNAPLKS